MTLENIIKDFINEEMDYFQKPYYDSDDYWHLFNCCTKEEEVIVKEELDKIKTSIEVLKKIQDDCYGR